MIRIKLFAGIAEKINKKEVLVDQNKMTVEALRQWLIGEYPELKSDIERAMIAVNEEFAMEETRISEEDIVAIIPPVSGG